MASALERLTGNGNLKFLIGDFGGALVAVIGVLLHLTVVTWAGFAVGMASAYVLAFRIRSQSRTVGSASNSAR